jgi:arsenate reductase
MAEAFARAYGSDVLVASSAGFSPASRIPDDTLHAMEAKNLDMAGQLPKAVSDLRASDFDLIINMSGFPLRESEQMVREWAVPDPVSMDYEEHCQIRDQIENLVMSLILELRREEKRLRTQS